MAENAVQERGTHEAEDADDRQLVAFKLGDEEFGVDIERVKEIVRLPDITAMPRSPGYVVGICNLRGSVLPVVDARTRFNLSRQEATEATRLLVVESGGLNTGLIVDRVSEVMRVNRSMEEAPPGVSQGVDKQFLEGVVKMDEGKRLVLTLDLSEVVHVKAEKSQKTEFSKSGAATETAREQESLEEDQLVSFIVGKEEYAFNIEKVREILRVEEITAVPNVPEYVKGLFTIRNQLMPVLDLRTMLGQEDLLSELKALVDKMESDHDQWADGLKNAVQDAFSFKGENDPHKCPLGKWLEEYSSASAEIGAILKNFKKPHMSCHINGGKALDLARTSGDAPLSFFEEEVTPSINEMKTLFVKLKDSMRLHIMEDQRVLVVEAGAICVGLLVDNVNEVVRIPRSIIEDAPDMALSTEKELKGVAKLNEGKRLIMIMDENSLLSGEDSKVLSEIGEVKKGGKKMHTEEEDSLARQSLEEEQLVTFSINKEEFGIRIMQIQEINRLAEITKMPKAPYFIEGVTNLRGNVVPLINIRKRFDLDDKEADDRTRIIIVDIDGKKTGLIVDQVNEVLRLQKKDIENTPSIVTADVDNEYMDGVGKIDGGKRMIVLLDVEKILSEKERKSFKKMKSDGEPNKATANKGTSKKRGKKKMVIDE